MKNLILILTISFLLPVAVAAQNTYVPDDIFEQVLIDQGYDSGPLNDSVPTKNIENVTYLQVSNSIPLVDEMIIKDLTGIEGFKALEYLHCNVNELIELDVSKNIELVWLHCSGNLLKRINVSKNAALEEIFCSINELDQLDLTGAVSLERLRCSANNLREIDVSKNIYLKNLTCDANLLENLDVSSNTELETISCMENSLTKLDVRNNEELKNLWCPYNSIEKLDLGNKPNLIALGCSDNELSELNTSDIPKLWQLACANNNLVELDLKNNIVLRSLQCYRNKLSKLDVSNNPELLQILCNYNLLTSLNIKNGNNPKLESHHSSNIVFNALNNPDLYCIQVDDSLASVNYEGWEKDAQAEYSEDCGYTGVEDFAPHIASIRCQPNPCQGTATIQFKSKEVGKAIIEIFDLNGNLVFRQEVEAMPSENTMDIDLGGYSPGAYFLQLRVNGRQAASTKMIVAE
jgi:type IX secretion system substrate protein